MSDPEAREKRSRRRKRNRIAKILYDPNEYRGAFSLKVLEDKTNYKRQKINPRDIELSDEE